MILNTFAFACFRGFLHQNNQIAHGFVRA